ncbi:MAG: helix-turn-helix transcriptional regulator [Tenuifilaceae bacterium]|jgi:transcriptional regulator with XRE-family HTH domain|nr:helix-turn-helix transcriptional regulator [Tenuifilaceae bacterium]
MTIGQRIRELRENAGMRQRELAAKLEIGEGFLSKVENDQKQIKREDLLKISNLFNVSMKELETLWLANKIYSIVYKETLGIEALRVAEEQVEFLKSK